ncbi:MAG: hypothetical protein JNJ59_25075 [Deltaproteobacteria bacterium]|nr:hypothetical protein [Deltaproteobacteria bacterium]
MNALPFARLFRRAHPATLALAATLALVACESDKGDSDATDTTDTRDTTGDTGDTTPTGTAPTLLSVTANQVGATGRDLRLHVIADDADKNIDHLELALFDAEGSPVLAFKSGLSETPDSNETSLAFDTASQVTNKASIDANATLRAIFTDFAPAKVEVRLVDKRGLTSDPRSIDIALQTVAAFGEACDPAGVTSRCDFGLGCKASTCQNGAAPVVTKAAYYADAAGVRILVLGTEPEDDLVSVLVEFLDAQNAPLLIDTNNDDVPDASSFEIDARGRSVDGAFFVRLDPSDTFASAVPQVRVTAKDSRDQVSAAKVAKKASAPIRSTGQTCDPRGFDLCNATSVCVPGTTGTSWSCKAASALRKTACEESPLLPTDGTPITGFASGASLYDPPDLCAAGDSRTKPEGMARLVLTEPASKVTLTTALAGTGFDTVLYVFPGCGDTAAPAAGCADDTAGPPSSAASTLVLTDLPAGSYIVVVDSWGEDGGSYALSATIE